MRVVERSSFGTVYTFITVEPSLDGYVGNLEIASI